MSDPDETAPFTHQPYGKDAGDNPFVSPSGPASQPSGPDYVTPPAAPPPTAGPVPYGPPPGGQPYGFQPGWAPAYGAPYAGSLDHKGATDSLVLGIVAIVSLLLTLGLLHHDPGCLLRAVRLGRSAPRPSARSSGSRASTATSARPQTGMWMGIVMTILGFLCDRRCSSRSSSGSASPTTRSSDSLVSKDTRSQSEPDTMRP